MTFSCSNCGVQLGCGRVLHGMDGVRGSRVTVLPCVPRHISGAGFCGPSALPALGGLCVLGAVFDLMLSDIALDLGSGVRGKVVAGFKQPWHETPVGRQRGK